VKLMIRKRAGNGDPAEALCESCGAYLGRLLGEVQHIVARGAGGTSLIVLNGAANGALLCGSAAWRSGCHGVAESRDADMGLKGFFILYRKDPRLVPMTLFDGREVYRSENGLYLESAPVLEAA
jgi:hypothetical protein